MPMNLLATSSATVHSNTASRIPFGSSLLAIALWGALAGTASAAVSTLTADNNADLVVNAGDTLESVGTASVPTIVNNGSITGDGTLSIRAYRTLQNEGTLNVANYGTGTSAGVIANEASGTVIVNNNSTLKLGLNNAGRVVSTTGTLTIENHAFTARAGGVFEKEDGSKLDKISVILTSGVQGPRVDAGAVLEAGTIEIDPYNQGFIMNGVMRADEISIKGYMNFSDTSLIEGKRVSIGQIDQKNLENPGGRITATEKLTVTSYLNLFNTLVSTPELELHLSANFQDGTVVTGVKNLTNWSTMSLYGNGHFENDKLENVRLDGRDGVSNGPRIQLMGEHGLEITNLTVGKSTNTSGMAISANLVDKMPGTSEGRTSFTIGNLTLEEGAIAAIYADDKPEAAATTAALIENVNLAKDAELQLGWRSGTYSDFTSKTIKSLTLEENAKVTAGTATASAPKAALANIDRIRFAGNNASVGSTLTGTSTAVEVAEGVTGAQLAGVETQSFSILLEAPTGTDDVTVASVADTTTVTLSGGAANNTGDAQADLEKIAASVDFTRNTDASITIRQEADGIHDPASGELSQDGSIENIVIGTNAAVYGIAETATIGFNLWRNEMNDLGKRLGDIRNANGHVDAAWARVFTGKSTFGTQAVENKYTAIQTGYDREIAPGVRVGAALGWTDGETDLVAGSGESTVATLTGYATWLSDTGFFDLSVKFGRIENEVDVVSGIKRAKSEYDTSAVSLTAEAGRRISLPGAFFIEPQVELMYGRVASVDYTTSSGVSVRHDAAETLVGRAGFVLGLSSSESGTAYVRASILHDWKGEAGYAFSTGNDFRALSEDLGGTWCEYGFGANLNLTEVMRLYADFEAADGGKVDTDYRVNLGMRYLF